MFMIKLVSHGLFITLAHTCNYVLLNVPSIIRTRISIQGGRAAASLMPSDSLLLPLTAPACSDIPTHDRFVNDFYNYRPLVT